MTLEEAIAHCDEVAERNSVDADIIRINGNRPDMLGRHYEYCMKCAEEHRQLAEWLKLLKRILDSGDCNNCAMLHSQCRYAPRLGEQVRYNCPFYHAEREESE